MPRKGITSTVSIGLVSALRQYNHNKNKTMILITGATDGIGLETARELAQRGHELVLHGRTEDKAQRALAAVQQHAPGVALQAAHADLSDFGAVTRMARELSGRLPSLDVLVNNAGVYLPVRQLNQDGIEMTLAVNHLSHYLLTLQLLPLLEKAQAPRVVTVSSVAHQSGHIAFDNINGELGYSAYEAYANSKLANVLFTAELARREPWLCANSLHPGVIDTKLLHAGFSMTGAPVAEGARTSVYLATAPEVAGVTGKYFERCAETTLSAEARDEDLAAKLWAWSEDAVRAYLKP